MHFYSTKRRYPLASLREAVMTGLAPDGGLFLPERIPLIPSAFFNNIADMSIRDIGYVVANLMLGDDIDSEEIRRIVNETFSFNVPLVKVDDRIFSLELFHGPTLAFKDVGARFLARIMGHYSDGKKKVKVLVATSGDSGGAVAAGFQGVPGVEVYVLYPHNLLTPFQKAQLNQGGMNVHPIEVLGTFDDCQTMVKEAFGDPDLRSRMELTSANSINICRLLPQTFYFFYAYAALAQREGTGDGVVISVPCGNLGNLTAGLLAAKMGLPVKRFAVANNINDTTVRWLETGNFEPKRSVHTVACAMDVGNPSNIDRILDIFADEVATLRNIVKGYTVTDEEILSTMSVTYCADNYLPDPHGAAALAALHRDLQPGEKGIFLETASPSKFAATVERATGVKYPPAPASAHSPSHHPRISASTDALRKILCSDL